MSRHKAATSKVPRHGGTKSKAPRHATKPKAPRRDRPGRDTSTTRGIDAKHSDDSHDSYRHSGDRSDHGLNHLYYAGSGALRRRVDHSEHGAGRRGSGKINTTFRPTTDEGVRDNGNKNGIDDHPRRFKIKALTAPSNELTKHDNNTPPLHTHGDNQVITQATQDTFRRLEKEYASLGALRSSSELRLAFETKRRDLVEAYICAQTCRLDNEFNETLKNEYRNIHRRVQKENKDPALANGEEGCWQ
ncbi:hypothetical protein Q8F55_004934 [Vanrija albida]|uniref:Uncharacterized protein n=1 Tax=Vanrija albida TaxID=181172 RepID=A0ABR3Q072_9TREE